MQTWKGLVVGGKTRTTEEGNHSFPEVEGEPVLTLVFKDDDKKLVLETHKGLHSNTVTNYLVSNILLLVDVERKDDMTCLKLNQYKEGSEYKVGNC